VRSGFKPERANELLSERTGADRRTIQKASVAHGNASFGDPANIEDDVLRICMRRYAARIRAILAAYSK
jgi:hypothetical protein